jgi:hypothetical protein
MELAPPKEVANGTLNPELAAKSASSDTRGLMRKLCHATCCLFLVCACACDTVRLAADSSAELFARAQPAIEQYFDYETAGKATPAGIMQLEGILRIVPDNERILLMTIGAYLGYGVGWIEDQLEEADAVDDFEQVVHLRGRLRTMYTRAWDLGQHALRLRAEGFDDAAAGGVDSLTTWLERNFVEPKDAEILLFAAQAWAAKIIFSLHDIDVVADFPLAKAILERSVALDPNFYFMQGKVFLALVAAQQFPPETQKSRKLFDEVLARTERRSLIVQVSMARYYAVAIGDYELFKSLLEEVLAAGDVLPEARLLNLVARRRAERYLRLAHMFFSDVEEARP